MLIHAHIKGSKVNIVAGEEHYLPVKNPKIFNKVVIDFLSLENR